MRWGMAIELKRCVGCYECVLACKAEHFLPPDIFWNRLLIGEQGKYPQVTKLIYSVRCNHCADPACVKVCPTGATQQREDGIVWVDEDKCVGCRYCMVACPYQMRSMYEDGKSQYFPGQELTEHEKIGKVLYPHMPGVVTKCVFCKERIDAGLAAGLTPGVDREATPACVISCPTKAIHFGDLDDPNSEINRVIKEKHGHSFHPEFDTQPSISYID
ncbi:MAG: 4Fe-4S dicluster domain-containing protein [Dehalococcoidales bacterium]|nr:4Fe-4S dicluster domain-containing protein [Dehalococcoidales bacterium]